VGILLAVLRIHNSFADPDPVKAAEDFARKISKNQCWGSGSSQIRTFLSVPDPEILDRIPDPTPLKVLIIKGTVSRDFRPSEKVIFSQEHFQLSFSPNHEKNLRTFGHNYLHKTMAF
jgi:hypothetical protein